MLNPPVFKTALNFGAMSALAGFAVFLGLYYSGYNPLGPSSWAGAWIPILFMVLGIKNYRDHASNGYVSYWKAFRCGLLIASCGAFLYSLLVYIFGTIVDQQLLESFKAESLIYLEQTEELSKSVFGESVYQASVDNIQKSTMSTIASQEFFNKMFGGFLVSFITAAFLRKNPPINSMPDAE